MFLSIRTFFELFSHWDAILIMQDKEICLLDLFKKQEPCDSMAPNIHVLIMCPDYLIEIFMLWSPTFTMTVLPSTNPVLKAAVPLVAMVEPIRLPAMS